MIVSRQADRLRFVTQGDHAHLAGEILSLFRLPELVDHPHREHLLRAVREHDNGWREIDAAPSVEPGTGRPHDYRSLPSDVRRELWTRGARRFAGDDPYVALLITRHGRRLHLDRGGEEGWREWFEALDSLEAELLEVSRTESREISIGDLEADYEWLAIADAISLALCEGNDGRFESGPFQVQSEGTTLRIDPFPLAGATTFRLSCRHLLRRRYRDDRDLGSSLARSRWDRLEVRLAPPN